MTRQTSPGDDPTRVPALDDIRPPAENLVTRYDVESEGDLDSVKLDEPVPESELPDDAIPTTYQMSMDEMNERNEFVIVHQRVVRSDADHPAGGKQLDNDESGVIRCLAPSYSLDCEAFWEDVDTFDTWQAAEAFVAEHFEQPEAEHERIIPFSATRFAMDVQRFRMDEGADDRTPSTYAFYENVPTDEAFFADAIPIDA